MHCLQRKRLKEINSQRIRAELQLLKQSYCTILQTVRKLYKIFLQQNRFFGNGLYRRSMQMCTYYVMKITAKPIEALPRKPLRNIWNVIVDDLRTGISWRRRRTPSVVRIYWKYLNVSNILLLEHNVCFDMENSLEASSTELSKYTLKNVFSTTYKYTSKYIRTHSLT